MPASSKYCVSTMPTYSKALSVAIIIPPRRNCTLLAAAIGST